MSADGCMPDLDDMKDVFDLFDFWDGRDGLIDAFKVGDLLRCCGLNPTDTLVRKTGGTKKMGEKQYSFEEFLPIVKQIVKEKDTGTKAEFMEAFKSFDREGMGFISLGETRHMLTAIGDRLEDRELDDILELTDIQADLDGNIKYEDFIQKVLDGPKGC
ncbi:myosin, essential light chain, adductor muscle-like [Argopecten irradians]|uniref:myosin, essential light chain, adductor muscle-like n=1 Tax=Argopecten irradians TaxID=31199 RepID=UPI0037160BB9